MQTLSKLLLITSLSLFSQESLKAEDIDNESPKNMIEVLLPEKSRVMDSNAVIHWTAEGVESTYIVSLTDLFDRVVYQRETTNNYFKVNFVNPDSDNAQMVFFSVALKGNEEVSSNKHLIQTLSKKEQNDLRSKMNEELEGSTYGNDALACVTLANFYEQYNLLVDASDNYIKAIELSSDEDSVIRFNEFKNRNFQSN